MLGVKVINAQSIAIKYGKNLTKYKFGNGGDSEPINLQNKIGQNYEFNFTSYQDINSKYYYGFSAGVEERNANGSYLNTNLNYETTYANFKVLGYSILFRDNQSQLSLKGGLGLSTLIYGRQQINGVGYNLIKDAEFNGFFIGPQIGLSYDMAINRDISLRLDYDYAHQFSLTNTTRQKLQFTNHCLSLGLSINIY